MSQLQQHPLPKINNKKQNRKTIVWTLKEPLCNNFSELNVEIQQKSNTEQIRWDVTYLGGFSTVRYVLKAWSCCWTPVRELASFLLFSTMMVCSIHVSKSDASVSYLSIILSVSIAWSRTWRRTAQINKCSGLNKLTSTCRLSSSPFQLAFPRLQVASSLRNSDKMQRHTWWWISHLGSLWKHL